MISKKVGLAAGAVATVGAALAGGTAMTAVASSSGSTTDAQNAAYGVPAPGGDGHGWGGAAGHDHTPVSGAELTRVKDAVRAEDPGVTVESVRQDPDGSYDVFGTKDGGPVMLEVAEDLKTVTESSGPGGHGRGGPHGGFGHGSADTPVTGAELTRVTDAVEEHDSAVTVRSVRRDPDGSYDVFGTKGGVPVMLEVSRDLRTITENTGGGHVGDRDGDDSGTSGSSSETGFLRS